MIKYILTYYKTKYHAESLTDDKTLDAATITPRFWLSLRLNQFRNSIKNLFLFISVYLNNKKLNVLLST